MTGIEHAIEQAALAIHADHCCPCDPTGCDAPDGVDYNAARAVAEAGLLAPAPLREITSRGSIDEQGLLRPHFGADQTEYVKYQTGWLSPAPLREEWGTRFNEDGGRIVAGKDSPYPFFWDDKDPEGENVRRYITDWLSADSVNRAEGDGKAVTHE